MPLLTAIDLGTHAVKVTTYRSAGRRTTLEDRFSFPVPQSGAPVTLQSRLAALEALVEDHPGWEGGTATIGLALPTSEVSFRPMQLPFADKAQVEKTLPFAIEGEVPYDLDEMVLGWRHRPAGSGSEVMSVLARKDVLTEYLDALKDRKLNPRSVIASGELYGFYTEAGVVAIVDVGHENTNVTVVEDGVVRASRAINVAGHAFTRAIQTALQCDWTQAEAMKHGQIIAEDATDVGRVRSGYATLPTAAREAVDASMGQLLAEVRSTLIRFEDSLCVDIARVKLCGGSARIPELREYLQRDLGLEVDRCVDEDGSTVPAGFEVTDALGAVLAGLSERRPVDLRIGEFAYSGGVNALRAILTYGTAGAVFFAFAAAAIFVFQYINLTSERSAVTERINKVVLETFPEIPADQLDSREKAEGFMREFTNDVVAKSALLPPANLSEPPTIDTLYALTSAFPPHEEVPVVLSHLEILPSVITFEGETDGFAQSAKIEESLTSAARFKRATKDSESRTRQGKVKFKFSIPLGEEKEES